MDNSFVIKGNICQTKNPNELDLHKNAFAVCVGGISKGIFEVLPEEYSDLPLYDYGDSLIFPGMVDLHIHAPQYAFRGMCMDLELMDWLNRYTFPEEEKYENPEYAKKAYGMFVDAMKKSATARACIFATRHRPATELLMELMEESGLISYVGKVNMDRESSEALTEDSAEISAYTTFGWINAVKDRFKNTKPILTPRFIPCCTDKLMEELREIQMAYGIPVQSHLSESKGEIEFVKFLRPGDPFYGDSYNDYDLFGKNDDINTDVKTVMAHCVWSTDEEVEAAVLADLQEVLTFLETETSEDEYRDFGAILALLWRFEYPGDFDRSLSESWSGSWVTGLMEENLHDNGSISEFCTVLDKDEIRERFGAHMVDFDGRRKAFKTDLDKYRSMDFENKARIEKVCELYGRKMGKIFDELENSQLDVIANHATGDKSKDWIVNDRLDTFREEEVEAKLASSVLARLWGEASHEVQ